MTLQDYISKLPGAKQFDIALKLAKLALPIWEDYADRVELVYRDSVVGMTHSVDKSLLAKALDIVERHINSKDLDHDVFSLRTQFSDPIVALQDGDWELPDTVQKVFYAVFNVLETRLKKRVTTFGDLTIYVAINQAADALETSGRLNTSEIRVIIYG